MSNIYGYILVENKEQDEKYQLITLEEIGVLKCNIYVDKQISKNFERQQYARLIERLKQGDIVYIQSIGHLGRNYDEMLKQWQVITKEKKADIVVMDMPLLDTRENYETVPKRDVADLVMQTISCIVQTERKYQKKRQAEGIADAKARGVRFGKKKIEIPKDFFEYKQKWENGEISLRQAATILNISHTSFHRLCREYEENIAMECENE